MLGLLQTPKLGWAYTHVRTIVGLWLVSRVAAAKQYPKCSSSICFHLASFILAPSIQYPPVGHLLNTAYVRQTLPAFLVAVLDEYMGLVILFIPGAYCQYMFGLDETFLVGIFGLHRETITRMFGIILGCIEGGLLDLKAGFDQLIGLLSQYHDIWPAEATGCLDVFQIKIRSSG